MHPDLVRATSLWEDSQQAIITQIFPYLVTRACRAATRDDRHTLPLAWVPANWGLDDPLWSWGLPVNQSQVGLLHPSAFELLAQVFQRLACLGHHDEPRCIPVQAMYNPRPPRIAHD